MITAEVEEMQKLAAEWEISITGQDFAKRMDEKDPLKKYREEFFIPPCSSLPEVDLKLVKTGENNSIYLSGNSLGLLSKSSRRRVDEQMDKWAKLGVFGHTHGVLPWAYCDEEVRDLMAEVVGGQSNEVILMNALSVNLHLMMVSFYRPTPQRHKIILENHAFPSDHYVVESQIKLHGFDPKDSLILIKPREGEATIRHEDFLSLIESEGEATALIICPGVQYYTGQLFDIPGLVEAGHKKGCFVCVNLAHAVGNVELKLHDWKVDFACWCTYKYLNSGAGGIGGVFLHDMHAKNNFPKLLGWWAHKMSSRFEMNCVMDQSEGVDGYRISNPSMFLTASLLGSLEIFHEAGMERIRQKSRLLTSYLEFLLKYHYAESGNHSKKNVYVRILTPDDPNQRGAQLSIMFSIPINDVFTELKKRGVVVDKREPNVLRVAPAPLYNSFSDVYNFVEILGSCFKVLE